MDVIQRIAEELSVNSKQVSAAVALLDEGATVPFISRYRKEVTGGLDDTQLRQLEERLGYLRELNERRKTILDSIKSQEKLTPELEKAITAEIEKAQKELVSDAEFQKLRNKTENDFITANSTMAGIAENLSNYHVYFGDANLINTELDRYRKVTREDIRAAANKYFNKNARVVLYWLPKTKQP